jgi:hypothetical protein
MKQAACHGFRTSWSGDNLPVYQRFTLRLAGLPEDRSQIADGKLTLDGS